MQCPKCRSTKVTMQGWRVKAGGRKERKAQCQNCGHWMTLRAEKAKKSKK